MAANKLLCVCVCVCVQIVMWNYTLKIVPI